MPKHSRGFTLLELMLSSALFVVLLGLVWSTASLFLRTQTYTTQSSERVRFNRTILRILNDDLQAALQDTAQKIAPTGNATGDITSRHFGLSGSARRLRFDILTRHGDIQSVVYQFDETLGLKRELHFYSQPDIATPFVSPEVLDCRFRFFDGVNWSDSWSSLTRHGLPTAVELAMRVLPATEAKRWRNNHANNNANQNETRNENAGMRPVSERCVFHLPTALAKELPQDEPNNNAIEPMIIVPQPVDIQVDAVPFPGNPAAEKKAESEFFTQ